MTIEAIYEKVCGSSDRLFDVVFVHGLTGSPNETWSSRDGQAFWPAWLEGDLPGVAVHTIGYPASVFAKWAKQEMNIHERAAHALEYLTSCGIGQRPVAFICHSLGGILVKEMLRVSAECADDDWKLIAENTKAVIFLATPHLGADLAIALKFVAPRVTSSFIDELANQGGYLTSLNHSYRDLATAKNYRTVSYYEKYKTKGLSIVVSIESADPGVSGTRPLAIDANHIDICKPRSRSDIIYVSPLRHLRKIHEQCLPKKITGATAFSTDGFEEASEDDRRDLLQKLIDAGREHEYSTANYYQNQFAQKYHKLGLLTDAKTKSDELLASVKQRFVTHVYLSRICNGASDDKIAEALQSEVIDPLSKQGAAADSVLEALYFLTEQCYIRWDVE